MLEGSLEAPVRHPIDSQNPDFYDPEKLDTELHRVFDVCHGCRRCFNLCDSFPRLFDLIDESDTGEFEAYNPLVPNGRELVATMMIEIPDPDRRAALGSDLD